jgi:hypothetical protein
VSQLDVADLLDPALRTNTVFLGEVNLSKSKSAIAADVAEDIEAVSFEHQCWHSPHQSYFFK